jgi:hypothetical protein
MEFLLEEALSEAGRKRRTTSKRARAAMENPKSLYRPPKPMVAVDRESDVHGLEQRRILSSTQGSEPFRKFSTLLDSSTAYKHADSHRHDPFCLVLNMELLQFYYSGRAIRELANLCR